MSSNWHYARNGQRVGPFSFEELRRMASAGLILAADMVLEETTMKWRSARDVPGLYADPPPPPPPPTPPRLTPPVPPPPPVLSPPVPPPSAPPSAPPPVTSHPSVAKPVASAPNKPAPVAPGQPFAWIAVIMGAWWLLQTVGCIPEDINPFRQTGKNIGTEIAQAQAIVVSAETMAQEFQANEISADGKYKGKVVEITGIISRVQGEKGGWFGQRPSLQVGGIRCEFKEEEVIRFLSTGQRVTIRGKCKGPKLLSYCQLK